VYGTGTKTQWWLDATGGHAFSRDGWSWTYTGVAWGNATSRYNTPQGQGAKIQFTDGVTTKFTRLERPHLVFKTNEMVGDPIYLTNSAQYGDSTNPEGASANGTYVRALAQACIGACACVCAYQHRLSTHLGAYASCLSLAYVLYSTLDIEVVRVESFCLRRRCLLHTDQAYQSEVT
jgi:hypothetical protein